MKFFDPFVGLAAAAAVTKKLKAVSFTRLR
jgi:alkanesulfonate monooxygenase SsuD/methylene tetrahydromethanopterin reductase-like flavin-dependent oxidoreductase (luciferase family)